VALDRHDMAAILMSMGRFDEGLPLAESLLRYYEETRGAEHPSVAAVLDNLAAAYLSLRRMADAEKAQARSVKIHVATSGPDSLEAVDGLARLAITHGYQNRYAEARAEFEKVMPALIRLQGAESGYVLQARAGYGHALLGLGDLAGAEEQQRMVVAVRRRGVGQPHYLGSDLSNLANILLLRGDARGAEAAAREALSVFERTVGLKHPSAAYAYANLGDAERLLGRLDDAEERYRRSMAVLEATFGPQHEAIAYGLTGLGLLHLQRRQPAAARPPLERALALRAGGDPFDRAETQLALARAVVAGDPARARSLAADAVDGYTKAGARARARLDEAKAWLAAHR
jgi:tetratricopeptide (TPR) repeat protein